MNKNLDIKTNKVLPKELKPNKKVKYEYYDEKDFSRHEFEIDSNISKITNDLRNSNVFDKDIHFSISPVMCDKNGTDLFFLIDVSKTRVEKELQKALYRISISKIKNY